MLPFCDTDCAFFCRPLGTLSKIKISTILHVFIKCSLIRPQQWAESIFWVQMTSPWSQNHTNTNIFRFCRYDHPANIKSIQTWYCCSTEPPDDQRSVPSSNTCSRRLGWVIWILQVAKDALINSTWENVAPKLFQRSRFWRFWPHFNLNWSSVHRDVIGEPPSI